MRSALIDGEVAIVLPDGRTSFQDLQNSFSGGSRRGLAYFALDLLHVGGETLLLDELASYGADVVVEHPAELRAAVIERLTRLAAMSA